MSVEKITSGDREKQPWGKESEEEVVKEELGGWEVPQKIEHKEGEIDEIERRASFKKVEVFAFIKDLKNGRISALVDGSYILEFLDDKGEQKEVYYFDKDGNLVEFIDVPSLLKELKDTGIKIINNLERVQGLMLDMLLEDPVFTKNIHRA